MTSTQTWVQRQYGVPARRGLELIWHERGKDGSHLATPVTITSCRNARIYLRFPDIRRPVPAHPTYALEWPEVPQPKRRGWCWGCAESRGFDRDGNTLPHHLRDGRERWLCVGSGRPPTHLVVWRSGRLDIADYEAGV
jgi:hypothetical protein